MRKIIFDKKVILSITAFLLYIVGSIVLILTTEPDYEYWESKIIKMCIRFVPYVVLAVSSIVYHIRADSNPRNYVFVALLSVTLISIVTSFMGTRAHAYGLYLFLEDHDLYDAFLWITIYFQSMMLFFMSYIKKQVPIIYWCFMCIVYIAAMVYQIVNIFTLLHPVYVDTYIFLMSEILLYSTIMIFSKLLSAENVGGGLECIFETSCLDDDCLDEEDSEYYYDDDMDDAFEEMFKRLSNTQK